MSEKNNLLVKLENGGIFKSSKWLVRGVSLEINKGQIVTLIGPNGSGKTTTAKMVLDILSPDEGVMKSFTKKMAYVPQKISIDWTMPLRVIDFMQLTSKLSQNEIIESLNLTGVEQLLYNQISNLSGGEFQRVLIARAVAKKSIHVYTKRKRKRATCALKLAAKSSISTRKASASHAETMGASVTTVALSTPTPTQKFLNTPKENPTKRN